MLSLFFVIAAKVKNNLKPRIKQKFKFQVLLFLIQSSIKIHNKIIVIQQFHVKMKTILK